MREVMNISLPASTVTMIKKEVKSGGFASVSEFMRHLIRLQLADQFKRDHQAFLAGKGKKLKSLKDLR